MTETAWPVIQWVLTMLVVPGLVWMGKEVRDYVKQERDQADAVLKAFLETQRAERERAWSILDANTAALLELTRWLKQKNGHGESG